MSESPESARLSRAISLPGTVAIGALTALQARVNGSLGTALGDPFVTGVVSFGSGLVIVAIIVALLPAGRAGVGRLMRGIRRGGGAGERSIPIWMLFGGFAGAFTVATQGLTVATIGVALFTVGLVAGQTACGLILDRVGYGPAGVVRLTTGRVVGALLAIAGVIACLVGEDIGSVPWPYLVLPFVAGAGIAWQQATNGRLRESVESPLTATLVNFAGGTAALIVAALVHIGIVGAPKVQPGHGIADAWMYLGGAIGVAYIFMSAALVRRTGVLLLGLGSVVGLLSTSVVLDALWPAPSGPSLVAALVAAALALVGAVIAAVPWGRARR
ncbi:DMT family transporter [uncultured Microbacterium sp.]|uniref:DMT family transporter n=1 Tax=uncultured Microbacterium sp. TaxID=191216 RepID=UPI0025E849A2|nr:DMT family transporter [uncultured Microbacterium sp.]